MVTEIKYTTVNRILDDLLDHPLLNNLTLEQVVRYVIRFIGLHGYPKLYQDKISTIEIKNFRGVLPCDLISINQVKDLSSGKSIPYMSEIFTPELNTANDTINDNSHISEKKEFYIERAFKTQGRIIYTTFSDGNIEIAYKAIPIDDNGYPLIIDNETYLNALEAYIKVKVFTIKFDTGDLPGGVLNNAQTEYAWAAKEVQREFIMPSMSEMESITRMLNTMVKSNQHFDNGFKNLRNREYFKKH